MHNFTATDSILLLIYIAFVIGIGVRLRSSIQTSRDFFEAGRALPNWICVLGFIAVSLGAPELIGMGAAGARYGIVAAQFYGLGTIPAMLFLGLYMMPVYYSSGARSVPDYLGLRFDGKTRALSACLFLAMAIFCAALSLCVLAQFVKALHVFDDLAPDLFRSPQAVSAVTVVLTAVIVLSYILPGGLTAVMYNQAIQFLLLVAALLPLVFLGLNNIGGWSELKGALSAHYMQEWRGRSNSIDVGVIGTILGLGVVLGFSYWCTDLRVLQTAIAARDKESARRVPIIAAIPQLLLPFLVVLPGVIAIALPTPHTTTSITTSPEGAIIHNIQVVAPEMEQGKGIVPAITDPVTRKPFVDSGGHALLDFNAAIPGMLLHYLPSGLLGLGLTALIAAFMSGMAGTITAFSNVFTCDLYKSHLHPNSEDRHYLLVGRIVSAVAIAMSIAIAYGLFRIENFIYALLLVFSVVSAPLLAAVLLGMFWRRATGHGAFVGLLAGAVASVLHDGLTLADNVPAGIHGGWIRIIHHYSGDMVQVAWGAIYAFLTSFIASIVVSLLTAPKEESELVGLTHFSTDRHTPRLAWWKRPEALAVAILIATIALNLFIA